MTTLGTDEKLELNKNAKLALASMFSAMAAVITLLNLTIPFPILPYLKIDLTEIPVILSFYLLNPVYGLLTATIYWVILTMRAGNLLGPAMKYSAVVSMILGYWAVERLGIGNKNVQLIYGLVLGSVVRIIVMSVVNYYVIVFVAPYYLDFITGLLSATGLPSSNRLEVMTWTLIITGVYNLVHSMLSILPAYYLTQLIRKRLG
ncbi:MAG: ECF transporter S component [archaeon]